MAGFFYNFLPARFKNIGQGIQNEGFAYPFTLPAVDVIGSGDYCGNAPSPTFTPSYYTQQQVNLSAQGGGNIQGNLAYTTLMPNFYKENSPSF